jgi:hypothetical protein
MGGRVSGSSGCSVALAALLTLNLLDSRAGRAIPGVEGRGGGGGELRCGYGAGAAAGLRVRGRAGGMGAGGSTRTCSASVKSDAVRLQPVDPVSVDGGARGRGHIPGALLGAGLVTLVNDRLQDILPRLFGARELRDDRVRGPANPGVAVAPEGLWPLIAAAGAAEQGDRGERRPVGAAGMPAPGRRCWNSRGCGGRLVGWWR